MERKCLFDRPAEPHELVPEDYFAEIDPMSWFAGEGPLEVDLGCGDGRFILGMAEHFPERTSSRWSGFWGGFAKSAGELKKGKLENLKVLRLESLYTLEWLLPSECLDRVHLLCPDPWPKAKHHRRRLFQGPFWMRW